MWIDARRQKPAAGQDVLVWVAAHGQALVGRYNHSQGVWEIADWDEDDRSFYVYDAPWPIVAWQAITPPLAAVA